MISSYPYEAAIDPTLAEMDGKGVEKVAKIFLQQQRDGIFPGGQLVARRHGKVVLNIACGLARGWQGRGGDEMPVTTSTPFSAFSSGKPMAAIVIALLESRGEIDIQDTVAKHLTEFGTLGREAITIQDVLTHQAGTLLPALIHTPEMSGDPEALWQLMIETPPHYPRGTFAYMPTEYGIILDRLVSKLTGKNIATILHEELIQPLGLPNMQYGLGKHQLDEVAWNYWLGKEKCMVAEMNIAHGFEEKMNIAEVFSAQNPAFGMSSDAANLAAFYEFLVMGGKTKEGTQLIPAEIIQRYTSKQVSGWNKSINTFLSIGYGFMLGTPTPSLYDWWQSSSCFGHPGVFSSLAFADHKTGLSVAMISNGNKSVADLFKRSVAINHGLRKACS